MEHIYIAMVDTPGIFAAVIRGFLKQRYIHVVIGLDAELKKNRYIDFSDKRGARAQ